MTIPREMILPQLLKAIEKLPGAPDTTIAKQAALWAGCHYETVFLAWDELARTNEVRPRNTRKDTMGVIEHHINAIIAENGELSSREVMRRMGRTDDRQIRKYWDRLHYMGRVPERPRAALLHDRSIPDPDVMARRQQALEQKRSQRAPSREAIVQARKEEEEQWRADHEARGGKVAKHSQPPPKVRSAYERIGGQLDVALTALIKAVRDPELGPALLGAEMGMPQEFRLSAKLARIDQFVGELSTRL